MLIKAGSTHGLVGSGARADRHGPPILIDSYCQQEARTGQANANIQYLPPAGVIRGRGLCPGSLRSRTHTLVQYCSSCHVLNLATMQAFVDRRLF